MNGFLNTIDKYKRWLTVPLLALMLWQQKVTFEKNETAFSDPIAFAKNTFGTDYISQYSNRYSEFRKTKSSPFYATYIGETKDEENNENPIVIHYYLTQYNLAPAVLYNDEKTRDTIIYNRYTSRGIESNNYYLNNGWHIVRDCGNGIIILAK